jgi:acyl-CoA thioesterase-1
MRRWAGLLAGIASSALACGPGDQGEPPAAAPSAARSPAALASAPDLPKVVFLGDSLTAGYRLPVAEAFPALLAERLAASGRPARVVNAGVSGDTTAGGLARLDWILSQQPDLVVVELGANDGLRGLPLEASEANLRAIVEGSRAAGAEVLLLAMRLPPNYGADYTRSFEAIYPRVAAEAGATLVPFFLAGIAGQPELNLPDGIHPNAAGHRRAAENLLPHVVAAVEEAS